MKGLDAVVIGTPDHQHCRMLPPHGRAKTPSGKTSAMEMKIDRGSG
jgi:hypothetical protein